MKIYEIITTLQSGQQNSETLQGQPDTIQSYCDALKTQLNALKVEFTDITPYLV